MRVEQGDRIGAAPPRRRHPVLFGVLALVLLGVLALVVRGVLRSTEPASRPVTVVPLADNAAPSRPAPKPATPPAATDLQPAPALDMVEEAPPAPPLPALEHSDPEVRATLSDILPSILQPALAPEETLRRGVVMAANFARGKLLRDKLPLPAPGGRLIITTRGERSYLAEANFARYNGLADACAELDTDAFARWFTRYEPLLQQAWKELGTGSGDVRGALVAGLDVVLAAPELQGEIELVQPAVFYKYADPALEALPDTQKLMIRIGPANRQLVKQRARSLRDALAARL